MVLDALQYKYSQWHWMTSSINIPIDWMTSSINIPSGTGSPPVYIFQIALEVLQYKYSNWMTSSINIPDDPGWPPV
jgi:hypothetical protein